VEGVWENNWALKHGVDLDQVIVSRTEFAEQGLDIVHSCLLERAVDLVVIDSLAQLSTTKELDSSQEDTKVALNARAVNEFLRKCVADLNSQKIAHKSTVILINQIRYSVGAYGDPETMPGGMGQEFASSVDVRLQRYRVVTDKGKLTGPAADNSTQGVPVGAMTNFRITKNKTSPPHRSGEYCIWFSDDENSGRKVGDVDCSDALFEYGVRCGVLSKEGRSYVFTDLEGTLYTLDTKKDAVKRQIFEDDRLYKSLQEAVLNKLTGSVSSDSDARVL
jgi:recombination protein RecA